jgi:ABC-type oligopeptide transport system substrate-binding subunit
MSHKKAVFTILALVMVLALLATPFGSVPAHAQDKFDPKNPPPKETLFYGRFGAGDVPTLDPSLAEDTSSIQVGLELFVGLTRLDETNGNVLPGMATKWDISEDGKVYTFHLRDDLSWSDGVPITSADVMYTWAAILEGVKGTIDVPGSYVVDPTGAGDSATAGTVLALVAGATLPEAALVGNLVASITVQQLATTGTARPDDLLPRLALWRQQHGG